MQNAKYVFVTYSEPNTPGHHHVNCEEKPYWVELFKKYGGPFPPARLSIVISASQESAQENPYPV